MARHAAPQHKLSLTTTFRTPAPYAPRHAAPTTTYAYTVDDVHAVLGAKLAATLPTADRGQLAYAVVRAHTTGKVGTYTARRMVIRLGFDANTARTAIPA